MYFLKLIITVVFVCLPIFSAERLKDAILNKKSADQLVEIFMNDMFADAGIIEEKLIEFLPRIHDELKNINLPNDIRRDFKERESIFYARIQKIDINLDRYKISQEIDKCYLDFVVKFLIDYRCHFSEMLFQEMKKKNGELPSFLAYTFWLEISKDNKEEMHNPFKKIYYVPTLICLNFKKQKLILLTDGRHGTYSQFSTFLFDGKTIKKIVKMKHHFRDCDFSLKGRDVNFDEFTKFRHFSSNERSPDGFLYKWDNNILFIKDQGSGDVHTFELIHDVWHFID
ncbi:MAG: hypothetical protein HEEMFOPI_01622 [Holosporales bacterium]